MHIYCTCGFISHLSQSVSFRDTKDGLRWWKKTISLSYSDVCWISSIYDWEIIIDGCGEFPNVPLLGTKGGISYNPILAHRQFGYPMLDKPNNFLLAAFFLKEGEDNMAFIEQINKTWLTIHRK